MDEGFSAHLQELRRGTIVLACLELLRIPGYGYGLLQELEQGKKSLPEKVLNARPQKGYEGVSILE